MMLIHKDTPKEIIEELSKDCKKCGHCCSYDGGIVLEKEIANIAKFLGLTKEEFKKKYLKQQEFFNKTHFKIKRKKEPFGECLFLDKDKRCSIYPVRPEYCRVASCKEHGDLAMQWFHLQHSVDVMNPDSIREWNSYAKQKERIIEGGNPEDLVDKDILRKILNYEILK